MPDIWDIIVIGGGTAGIPCAIFSAFRGARVLVIEHAPHIGGTLHYSWGEMSAAGTRRQRRLGINDSPASHMEDINRLSGNTADPGLASLAVNNAAATADWLEDLGYEPLPDQPTFGLSHEPYTQRRSFVSAGRGLAIKEAISEPFQRLVDDNRVSCWLETEAVDLNRTSDKSLWEVGVRTSSNEKASLRGRTVVLTSGGFAANPCLYHELMGRPQYSSLAYPFSQGMGTKLALKLGGWVRGADRYLCQFGPILQDDARPAGLLAWADIGKTLRKPWEIYVNADGKRFVAEDDRSVHNREHALLKQPDCRFWIVFDQAIATEAPPLIKEWSKVKMMAAFATEKLFYKADTLTQLAVNAGIEPITFKQTVQDYNEAITSGPDEFNRVFCPKPLTEPPFFAIRSQGTTAGSCAGIAVDETLRVLDSNSRPIQNLHAAGEILGSGQTMGQAFCGGMMVTPALTFGRLLGEKLLQW